MQGFLLHRVYKIEMCKVLKCLKLTFLMVSFIFSSLSHIVSGEDIKSIAKMRHLRTPHEMLCLTQSMNTPYNMMGASDACSVDKNIPGSTSSKYSFLDVGQEENNSQIEKDVFNWKIFARDGGGYQRKSGGDDFVVLIYNDSFRSSGKVIDLKDGSYEVVARLPSGTYKIEATLALSASKEIVSCEESGSGDCFFQNSVRGADIHLLKNCIWETISVISGPYDPKKLGQTEAEFKVKLLESSVELPICLHDENISDGRWISLKNNKFCPEGVCSGSLAGIQEFKLPRMMWVPWSCKLQMIQKESIQCQKCFKNLKKGITVVGDSVALKGYTSDFQHFLPKSIPVNFIKLKGILQSKVLKQKNIFKSSILVIAIGRHEFLHGSINDHVRKLKECIPVMKSIIKMKIRIVWVLPAAPRRHALDITSCQRFEQRWDRFLAYIDETLVILKSVPEIQVLDVFTVTTSAHPDWYRDNIHMHQKSGLNRILSQIILNIICMKYLR